MQLTSTLFLTRRAQLMVVACLVLFFPLKGVAMSLLFGTEVVLFSPMEGKITYKGKPAAHAKITRTIIWKGDAGETDVFYTSETGEFKLPIKKTKVRIPAFAEFVLTQEMNVFYEDQEFFVWFKAKQDLDEYGELGGKPHNFRCELTDKRLGIEDFNGLFSTSCKWDSIEKQGEK
jgi:hypothetical protein